MSNIRTTDVILFVLFLSAIVLVVVDMYRLKSATAECVKNPLVYGVKQLEEVNNAEAQCSCSLMGRKNYQPITVTSKGIAQTQGMSNSNPLGEMNLSIYNFTP